MSFLRILLTTLRPLVPTVLRGNVPLGPLVSAGLAAAVCCTAALAAHNPNPAPPTPEEIALVEAALPAAAPAKPEKPRKVLIFWLCEGFFHNAIPVGNLALSRLGEKTGAYESMVSDDPAMLRAENLAQFDAILFNSTTNLKNTYDNEALRQGLLDFVNSGKGIAGVHAAADNFSFWPEAACVIGGVFAGHPWTSGGIWAVKLDEPDHPFNLSFGGAGFLIRDEIYWWKPEPYSRDTLRVLTSLDFSNERNYAVRNAEVHKDLDVGITWYHEVGKGRVFYCSLGHNPDVYWNRDVLRHYLAGIQYALGDNPMDATPSNGLSEKPKPALFTEMAKDRWTHLTRTGMGAWREPKGDWRVVGEAAPHARNTKLLVGQPGKGTLLNGITGRTANLLSKTEHGDIEAHIEFMVSEGSNSGVYFQGRYEIQILDSFGVANPTYTDCGGIYQRWNDAPGLANSERGYEGHSPAKNASTAPGTWQSFDVLFQAPRFQGNKKVENAKFIKVVHNGVVVHENVDVTGPTRAAYFADERAFGPLMLQGDHGPVAYRNIRIRPLELATQENVSLSGPYQELLGYEFGDNRRALTTIEAQLRGANQQQRHDFEAMLLAVLSHESATFAAKQFVCRTLRQIGTAQALPALEDLLYDPELSDSARLALEGMPYPKVDIALRTALRHTDGTTRIGIVNSIGARKDAKAVDLLAPIAEPGASVRPESIAAAEAAIAALGRIGTIQAANYLRPGDSVRDARNAFNLAIARQKTRQRALLNAKALQGAQADERQIERAGDAALKRFDELADERAAIDARLDLLRAEAYLQCADKLAAAGETRSALTIYKEMSAHAEAELKASAFRGWAHAAPNQAVDLVATLLKEESPTLREMGGRLASEIAGDETTLDLAQLLPSLGPPSQELLVAALGTNGDASTEPVIRELASSEHEAVRTAALRALATTGTSESIPVLLSAAGNGDSSSAIALESLLSISAEGVDTALIQHLRTGDVPTRLAAIRAVEGRRAATAVPALMGLVDAGDPGVLPAAYAALGALATEKQLPKILDRLLLTDAPSARGAIENALAEIVLRANNPDDVASLLVQRVQSADMDARVSLINVLGRLHTDSSLTALHVQYKAGDERVKRAVVRAFGAWDHPAPAALLEQIASSEPDSSLRVLALRGYIDLIKLPNERAKTDSVMMLSRALAIAERPEEKKAAIGALAEIPSRAALELVSKYLEEDALKAEAQAAAEAIRKALPK